MSTPLCNGRITGKGGDHDTNSAHLLQSEVIERSLPEAHRPRGLSLEAIENIGASDRAHHICVLTIITQTKGQAGIWIFHRP